MGLLRGPWTCSKCGGRSDVGVAPDASNRCERCAELSVLETREEFRRGVVARLRAYYSVARELVDAKKSVEEHHGHLEWILGTKGNPDRDHAGLDARTSELMVLWLEDLASDLDVSVGVIITPKHAAGRRPAEGRRESAAKGLREATREFADAFLTDRVQEAGCP